MKIDFEKVHIIKELGHGLYGTTYLVKYNMKLDKEYALKIQHVLEKDIKKNYNNEIWRELSLYKYIDKLTKEEQLFFTKYDYSICKCEHKQKRYDIKSHPNYKKIIKLDKSPWCIKYLIEYKGMSTLTSFLQKKKISSKLAYSFALQIAKIMLTLYKGGYSHNDMHFGNIMVTKTSKKYFTLNNKKIPYCGYQLNSIDYGEVLHKKFGINKIFLEDREKWLYYEYSCIFRIFNNEGILRRDCREQNKKLPWEWKGKINREDMLFRKIIVTYTDLFNEIKEKYLSKETNMKLLNKIVVLCKTNNLNKPIYSYVANKKGEDDFWWFYNRLLVEFRIKYPEKYVKYIKWCSVRPFAIPIDELKELLPIRDIYKLIEKIIMFLS